LGRILDRSGFEPAGAHKDILPLALYRSRMLLAAPCGATVEPTVYKLQVAAVFWVAALAGQVLGVSSVIR